MSEANDPAGPVVVVVAPGAEASGGSSEGGEVAAPETVETVADAAVQIAEIEANRDVDLAIIHTEADAQRAERYASEELEQCRNRIAELEGENSGLREALATATALIPPPSELSPPNPPDPDPSPDAEAHAQAPAESPAVADEPPKPRKRGIKWI